MTGAGGELGRATAALLANREAAVAVADRDPEALAQTVELLASVSGGEPEQLIFDQRDQAAVSSAVEEAADRLGGLDGLSANAGYAKFAPLLSVSPEVWERHVSINLTGTFFVCQAAARVMADRAGHGSIVVTASTLAQNHADQVGPYCVTKAGVLMLVRSLAAELGVLGVRVNSVSPGVIPSAMTEAMLSWPGTEEAVLNETPLGRLADAKEVAEGIAFLLSGNASYVTGTDLTIDGGQGIYGQPRWLHQDRSDRSGDRWVAADGIPRP